MPKKGKNPTPQSSDDEPDFVFAKPDFKLPFFVPPPLSSPQRDKLEEVLYSESLFEERFDDLCNRVLSADPVLVLTGFAINAVALEAPDEWAVEHPFTSAQLELLQALFLRNPLSSYSPVLPSISHLNSIREDLQTAFLLQSTLGAKPVKERQRVVENIQLHTKNIRNAGHGLQVFRIVREMLRPLDQLFSDRWGVPASSLVSMVERLTGLVADRIRDYFQGLRPVLNAKTIRRAADEFRRLYPDSGVSNELLFNMFDRDEDQLPLAKRALILIATRYLERICRIEISDLSDSSTEYPSAKWSTIFKAWSLEFGELSSRDPHDFFLDNPVWKRPLIYMPDGTYLLLNPSYLISFLLEMMEQLLNSDQRLLERYAKVRAQFLESETQRQFVSAFPTAQVFQGSKWADSTGVTFENDLTVLLDSHIIVVEVKSGKFTDAARRGGEDRLRRKLRDLLVEPAVQSARFAEILRIPKVHTFLTKHGSSNQVDTRQVRTILRLSITFESLGVIQTRWPLLRDAGFVPLDFEPAPSMSIFDLENIFSLLDATCEKLHYLERRMDFEASANYVADELDLLALYFRTGLNLEGVEYDHRLFLDLYGGSSILDRYFLQLWRNPQTKKPRRALTKLWRDILSASEAEAITNWTQLGCILLEARFDEQERFETEIRRYVAECRRRGRSENWRKPIILPLGGARRRNLIIGFVFDEQERSGPTEDIGRFVLPLMAAVKAKRAALIAVHWRKPKYPCSWLSIVRPHRWDRWAWADDWDENEEDAEVSEDP